jgi:hypothetical protein
MNREEAFQLAAERVQLRKEKEKLEEQEFYKKITSGPWWLFFKIVVLTCTAMFVISLVEHFFDGPSQKIDQYGWKVDPDWIYEKHVVLDVQGYLFMPAYFDWYSHIENSVYLVRTPIFRTGKKLKYTGQVNDGKKLIYHTQYRSRSIFNWFPFVQIMFLIPLFTFIFKRQSPWFNFARVISFVFVFPSTLLIIFFTML